VVESKALTDSKGMHFQIFVADFGLADAFIALQTASADE
jgi:hypothetical protein